MTRSLRGAALTWNRVDLERGVIRWEVGTTKNRAGRVLAFDALPALRKLLERWREITDATEAKLHCRIPWVFHREGWRIQKKRFYKVWHDACAKAEVLNAIPHDLRRAAVMRFERDGVPRKVAMSITGHKTESEFRWHQGFECSGTMGSSSSRGKRSLRNRVFSTVAGLVYRRT